MPLYGGWLFNGSTFAVARLRAGASVAAARDEYLAISNRLAPGPPSARSACRHVHRHGPRERAADSRRADDRRRLAPLHRLPQRRQSAAAPSVVTRARARRTGARSAQRMSTSRSSCSSKPARWRSWRARWASGLRGSLLRVLVSLAPPGIPRLDDIQFSRAPVATAIGISSLAVLCFGVIPLLVAARAGLTSPLRADARAGARDNGLGA